MYIFETKLLPNFIPYKMWQAGCLLRKDDRIALDHLFRFVCYRSTLCMDSQYINDDY